MTRTLSGLAATAGLMVVLSAVAVSQSAELRVVDASPNGELNQIQEATEIRIVFSEPMVALGRIPSNPSVPWVRVTPAINGAFRWSGTTILLFTPDPASPLPHSTRYTVDVDTAATSVAGRKLNAPHSFSFTTPTVRLTSMPWYRQGSNYTAPVTLILDFNQRVQPADIAAHATVRYLPHEWDPPTLTARERARMAAVEPNGVQRFDAKVAAARQAAARSDAIGIRVARDWDRVRFPPSDKRVVLETTTAPVAGGWLQLTLDTQTPSAEGPVRPPQVRTSTAQLVEVFFARPFNCTSACEPGRYNAVGFTGGVRAADFATALRVTDITTTRERNVPPSTKVQNVEFDFGSYHSLEDAGFDRQPPVTTYAYRLDPTLRSDDGQTLGYPWIGIIENWHENAFVSFGDGHGVWEKDGGTVLPFYARNYRTVTHWLTRVTPETLVDLIRRFKGNELPPGNGTARTLSVTPDSIQSHGLDIKATLATTGTGIVWAGLLPGEAIPRTHARVSPRSSIIQVTNLGITVKDSPQSTLLFVTGLDNGEPVAGADVTIYSMENKRLWRGKTGADGVAMAPAMPLRDPEDWYKLSFVATAEKDGDLAYVASNWNEGIMPWDFGVGFGLWEATDILRGSVFTDRGVYKPGEEVHFKAILRSDTPQGIRLLSTGQALDVVVRDNRGREIDKRTVTLTRWSSVEWTWTIPAEGTLGNYHVSMAMPGTTRQEPTSDLAARPRRQGEWLKRVGGNFLVAAYRRPDFRVDTTLTTATPVAGAELSSTVDAKYLFGGALAKRSVKWSIMASVTLDIPSPILDKYPFDSWSFGYYPDGEHRPRRVAGETVPLDAEGRMTGTVTSESNVDYAQHYLFEADVEDISRQHIANRSGTVVHPAPFYVGIKRPKYFVDTATGTSVDVIATALDGSVVADVPVTLTLTRIQWNSVRRSEGGGFYTWDTERVRVPAGEWRLTTGTTPKTQLITVPEGGFYELTAEASDAAGHRTKTETNFYGLGKGYTAWERFDHNRISLEPERKSWKPGETARVMIKSPWESATALLTVEREGVRSYRRFTLTSTQQTVEVPVTEDDIPNLYVSVLLIRGRTSNDPGSDGNDPGKPAFKLGYAEINVEDATKRLKVEVAADRAEYRPANTAKVSLAVTDAAGRGTPSEVTLWAVDYGVLSLTEYQAPDVLKAVYRDKALQVLTEDSRQRIVSRRVITPKGDGEGGGGGEASAFRRDFRPLAFWLGSVETDATGRATRDVKLPESLTTYRIMAVAADNASRFGSGRAEIKVNKPINLLPSFPRFLTLGDRATFGATVASALTTAGRATVTIRSLDPALLTFAGNASQTIELGARGSEAVRFDAQARAVGTARVQMTVRSGTETDAFESTLLIQAPAPIETSAAFGETTTAPAVEKLTLPQNILPGIGGINVDLSSTALVGLGEGVRYLTEYQFYCAEQRSSAALALALAADLGGAFSMPNITPKEYRARADALIASLERYRCSDGGYDSWGQCTHSNAYLTAYVLHVRKVAHGLGVGPEISKTDPALAFLSEWMKRDAPLVVQRQPWYTATATYIVKTLAENGVNQDSNIGRILPLRDRMPIFALSYLADAMAQTTPRHPQYADTVRRVTNALKIEGDQAHAEELDDDLLSFLWSSNIRSTALVLNGLVARGDDPIHVSRLVRWLLSVRTKGRWGNTQENAMALEALVAYYRKYEADVPDMTATVTLGTRAIGTATFRGRSSASQQVRLAMPDLLRQVPLGAERDLAFSRVGTGRLYYATRVQYSPTTPLPALDNGMRIERRYERYVEDGAAPQAPGTSFAAGDMIRVTLTLTLPAERRYLAVVDAMPAGVEAVDSWFATTASDIANESSRQTADDSWERAFRGGYFDHVEKYDDRVTLFATRLSEGKHEFSYVVRATTAGVFTVAGTTAEEMYAPEVKGRAAAVVVTIK